MRRPRECAVIEDELFPLLFLSMYDSLNDAAPFYAAQKPRIRAALGGDQISVGSSMYVGGAAVLPRIQGGGARRLVRSALVFSADF